MSPVLALRGVSKVYPGGVTALREVELTIQPGELVAVVGRSGSGKSTLLHIMGTLDRPSTGTVCLDGHEVTALSDRRLAALRAYRVGFVFQDFHLAAGVSCVDNVADGLLYAGVPIARRRQRAIAALDRVGLAGRLAHRPHELSGGERQRVAVARAVIGDPVLLLADEPTGNLDTESGAAVLDLLYQLNASGTTIVLITHDQETARGTARQVRLRDGRVLG